MINRIVYPIAATRAIPVVFDAIGQGEIPALGLDCTEIRESMVQRVLALLR